MTQEETQLLIKDLSGRLFYGVVVQQSPKFVEGDVGYNIASKSEKEPKDYNIIGIKCGSCLITDKEIVKNTYAEGKVSEPVTIYIYSPWTKQSARPYLRPMSSMTYDEKREYIPVGRSMSPDNPNALVDWLNAHHFDYRGLIEKGLALEAPEGMYKTK